MDQARLQQWEKVRTRLRSEFGEATFNSWIKPLTIMNESRHSIELEAPTRFMRDWVKSHFGDRILSIWRAEDGDIRKLSIEAAATIKSRTAPSLLADPQKSTAQSDNSGVVKGHKANEDHLELPPAAAPHPHTADQHASEPIANLQNLCSPVDPRYRFDSFVVGKSNELAFAAAQRVAQQSGVKFNPLFLHGGVGLGKTHLMHAIAWHVQEQDPHRKVIYLSAEKFMYLFIRALRDRDAMSFKQAFRSVDVLMIDDVQFFSRKDSTQEEFFHTFNALMDQNKQIVLSADCSPSDLEDIEERVRSRLGWGLVADIHQTDYELRVGILSAKLNQAGSHDIDIKVLEFLAHRITSNVRELEGALNRLLAYAGLVGRPVTMEMAQEVLQDLLRANDRRITIEEIQKRVAAHYNIRMADMHSARRARNVARPRQVAMYLSKQLTPRSLPEIGRKFGGRDHTTVMHAVRRIEELRQTEASLAEDIDLLRRTLEA